MDSNDFLVLLSLAFFEKRRQIFRGTLSKNCSVSDLISQYVQSEDHDFNRSADSRTPWNLQYDCIYFGVQKSSFPIADSMEIRDVTTSILEVVGRLPIFVIAKRRLIVNKWFKTVYESGAKERKTERRLSLRRDEWESSPTLSSTSISQLLSLHASALKCSLQRLRPSLSLEIGLEESTSPTFNSLTTNRVTNPLSTEASEVSPKETNEASKVARPGRREAAALQAEVETEEEWQQLLTRKGLILADVYSEWCGPCIAMVSTLRKIKMEIGGDIISYAIVKNDHIADLERFRGKSEPVWMFIQDGKMVKLMFGAHCPNLRKALIEEIKRVQNDEEPEMKLDVSTRTPEEEIRWQQEEAIRKAIEERERAKEEAERREKYEAFLAQMMFELSEETALIFYPWVFKDEEGRYRDKYQSPPYIELTTGLFKQNFDVLEEQRVQFTEELIEKMFVESNVPITKELIAGLSDGRTIAMRLKGRRPHPDWPVPYPHECPKGEKRCPSRAINDVEDYLVHLITSKEPLVHENVVTFSTDQSYMERHVYRHEPDPENEEDFPRVDPAIWVPPQARSKVHVYMTLFSNYMELVHPYEEPVPPPPLCAFKFGYLRFEAVHEACTLFPDAIEYFGAFEFDKPHIAGRVASSPEDFEKKVRYKTGNEVFVIILRRVSEDAFLSFASIEPYFVTEDNDEAEAMIDEYFPEGAEDVVMEDFDDEEEEYEEEEEDLCFGYCSLEDGVENPVIDEHGKAIRRKRNIGRLREREIILPERMSLNARVALFVEIPFFARFGRAGSYLNIRCRRQRVCVTLAEFQPAPELLEVALRTCPAANSFIPTNQRETLPSFLLNKPRVLLLRSCLYRKYSRLSANRACQRQTNCIIRRINETICHANDASSPRESPHELAMTKFRQAIRTIEPLATGTLVTQPLNLPAKSAVLNDIFGTLDDSVELQNLHRFVVDLRDQLNLFRVIDWGEGRVERKKGANYSYAREFTSIAHHYEPLTIVSSPSLFVRAISVGGTIKIIFSVRKPP
ncbi:uncharacterized protein LOC143178233 [Calliopsis andreniformis]|uniref:uncharacterized protein LOC143178233 n=1 Tax=Calliopsis andreniformis TaxID=337506 RepID=UPI003FCED87C